MSTMTSPTKTVFEKNNIPRLLTPGPLAVHCDIKKTMRFDLGSRGPIFKRMTTDIRQQLLVHCNALETHSAVLFPGSGTFAIEAAIGSILGHDDKILVLVNGIYGERICKILRQNEKAFECLNLAADQPIDIFQVKQHLENSDGFTHIFFVHCETTTGVLNPYDQLASLAMDYGLELIVDAMSSFGGIKIDVNQSPTLCLIASSNKCIEAPAGISFCIIKKILFAVPIVIQSRIH
jgi:aspartate aminotransferase-like enzyme